MFTYTDAVAMAIVCNIVRPTHVNDQGALYATCPIRPLDGHDPRHTVAQCPACN